MKIIRTSDLRCMVRMSQQDWQGIGEKAGWGPTVYPVNPVKRKTPEKRIDPIEPIDQIDQIDPIDMPEGEPTALPALDKLEVQIEKYTDRTWAVYVNGQLLCVTVYKKGANAVKDLVDRLWESGHP